jgi:hypothetical protein
MVVQKIEMWYFISNQDLHLAGWKKCPLSVKISRLVEEKKPPWEACPPHCPAMCEDVMPAIYMKVPKHDLNTRMLLLVLTKASSRETCI